MRRADREVTDLDKIVDIIEHCTCCRIGFNDNGMVYIVPLNFGYEQTDDSFVLYFHSAKEGRKIDLIHSNPNVGFEMDTNYKLYEGELACNYSARYQSVIGNGVVEIVEDKEEKVKGLTLFMEHTAGKKDWQFDEKRLNAVAVLKLRVTEFSCKERQ